MVHVIVLDACVLHPAPLRDLFIRVARAGLVRARWTDAILDECFRSILRRRPELQTPLRRTRELMIAAGDDDSVQVTVTFAEYVREERETGDGKKKRTVWRRMVQAPRTVMLPLEEDAVNKGRALRTRPEYAFAESSKVPTLRASRRARGLFRCSL